MGFIKNLFKDKEYAAKLERYGLDAPEMTMVHREVILRKKFMKKLYVEWYEMILNKADKNGKVLELGSGGGFLKNVFPQVITSDILPLPNCDMVINAYQLPFSENELSAIVMIDTLHHMGECERFFLEAERTLKKGGKIVMIEPANTCWSRFIFKNFHHEPFNEKAVDWNFPSSGPMSMANGALPWIVCVRDKEKFHKLFSGLKIASVRLHTPFRYLLSGGMPYKSLLPSWMFLPMKIVETVLSPFGKYLAMFQLIEIEKK